MFIRVNRTDWFGNPYKKDLIEALCREGIARKVIEAQRKEIYELKEKVKELTEKINDNNIKK